MFRKKLVIGVALAITAAMLPGCAKSTTGSGSNAANSTIKIGVVMPLTGQISSFGQSAQNGLKLLQDQTNAKGGVNGSKIQFVFQDDGGNAANSVTVGQKLINNEKVVAIVGPLTSTCANALAPICQQYKIPMVTGTATNSKVTSNGDFVYRTCFIDPFQGKVVAKLAAEDLKAKTAAILYNNGDDYSNGLAQAFKTAFEAAGGKVVDAETYNTGDKDFNAQLTKIAPKKPDVLFFPDYYSTVAIICKQARANGITGTFLGGDGWDSADLFSIGGSAVDNSYFSNHYSPDDTAPQVQQFIKDYKAKYNTVPDAMAALNYDAGAVLLQSIQKAGSTDGEKIKAALKAYNGTVVSGTITFDANRDAIKPAVIIKTVSGKETFFKSMKP